MLLAAALSLQALEGVFLYEFPYYCYFFKQIPQVAAEMAQQGNRLGAKPDDSARTLVEGETPLAQVVL